MPILLSQNQGVVDTLNKENDGNCSRHELTCDMVIDILIGNIIQEEPDITNTNLSSEVVSPENVLFNAIKLKHKLDFTQNIAFEITTTSFILKPLQNENFTNDEIS